MREIKETKGLWVLDCVQSAYNPETGSLAEECGKCRKLGLCALISTAAVMAQGGSEIEKKAPALWLIWRIREVLGEEDKE